MNAFNRVVTVLLLLVLLLVTIGVAIFPLTALGWAGQSAGDWSDYLEYWEANARYLYVAIRVAIIVFAVLFFGVLLFLELRRRKIKTVRIVTAEGSAATVVTDSVSQRLTYHIDRLADVISVVPHVSARGRTVNVRLDLETSPEIDVPMKTDEVVAVAREVVEERMGLQLGKVSVRIKHAPYPEDVA
jgi:hypothetical protein